MAFHQVIASELQSCQHALFAYMQAPALRSARHAKLSVQHRASRAMVARAAADTAAPGVKINLQGKHLEVRTADMLWHAAPD